MDWYRSKLVLETTDSKYFQPIFDKWDEIYSEQSLLKVFLPAQLDTRGNPCARVSWGSYSTENPSKTSGFFNEVVSKTDHSTCTKLTADFQTKVFNPYIGYRRLSYLLPDVLVTIFDPDLSKDHWLMSFQNGEIIKAPEFDDFTSNIRFVIAAVDITREEFSELYPWIPTSMEDAKSNSWKSDCYYDFEADKLIYI